MSENYFNSLRKYIKECAVSTDHALISKMDTLYSNIFLLSKQGKFEKAVQELETVDQEYNQLVRFTNIQDHVNILRLPIIAYLYFKLDDFKKAEQYLDESIEASINLEKMRESFFLKMFRVQQYHNTARIYFKKKKYDIWGLKMKKELDQLLAHTVTLSGEEISVYVVMVDQLIYEVIKFSEIIKEDQYLEQLLEDLKFRHPLFTTNDSLKKLKNWCLIKSKIYEFEMDFLNSYEHIENVMYDRTLKELYKKSLLKSVAPYVSDQVFLDYLDILTGKKLIC